MGIQSTTAASTYRAPTTLRPGPAPAPTRPATPAPAPRSSLAATANQDRFVSASTTLG